VSEHPPRVLISFEICAGCHTTLAPVVNSHEHPGLTPRHSQGRLAPPIFEQGGIFHESFRCRVLARKRSGAIRKARRRTLCDAAPYSRIGAESTLEGTLWYQRISAATAWRPLLYWGTAHGTPSFQGLSTAIFFLAAGPTPIPLPPLGTPPPEISCQDSIVCVVGIHEVSRFFRGACQFILAPVVISHEDPGLTYSVGCFPRRKKTAKRRERGANPRWNTKPISSQEGGATWRKIPAPTAVQRSICCSRLIGDHSQEEKENGIETTK